MADTTYGDGDRLAAISIADGTRTAFIPKITFTDAAGAGIGTNANPLVTSSGTGVSSNQVQGNIGSGVTDSGNPVKVGGVYNATTPTLTSGQRGDVQVSPRGILYATLTDTAGSSVALVATNADAVPTSGGTTRLGAVSYGYVFDGTNFNRQRGDTSGTYVINAPSAAATVALTPVVGVGVSSIVVKASAGNFYSASVTNSTTAGFLIVYNANAAPAAAAALSGALILAAIPVSASGYGSIDMAAIPDRASAGIVVLFSTSTTTYAVPAALPLHMRGRAS